MNINLNGKIALVTGASRGIGKSIAQALAQAGAYVFATATSETGAEQISEYLGDNGQGLILNVNDSIALNIIIDNILKTKGQIDILVNNAGITKDGLAMRLKDEDWQAVLDTNLSSVFKLTQLVLKPMIKAKNGSIINITSIVGAIGNAGQCNYAASKAGVVAFSKSLAREVGSRGIRINCIAPGFIETDMTDVLSDTQKQSLQQQIALGRLGSTQDIANSVLFLASDLANYITGSVLHVNGGMHMND
ncbi:MAG: 3-oxoacyl-ACP reductase FabG [Pseudomonadota bacterium]|jgi:3-oxoacyl-[acyl-carrier protein] reductase